MTQLLCFESQSFAVAAWGGVGGKSWSPGASRTSELIWVKWRQFGPWLKNGGEKDEKPNVLGGIFWIWSAGCVYCSLGRGSNLKSGQGKICLLKFFCMLHLPQRSQPDCCCFIIAFSGWFVWVFLRWPHHLLEKVARKYTLFNCTFLMCEITFKHQGYRVIPVVWTAFDWLTELPWSDFWFGGFVLFHQCTLKASHSR